MNLSILSKEGLVDILVHIYQYSMVNYETLVELTNLPKNRVVTAVKLLMASDLVYNEAKGLYLTDKGIEVSRRLADCLAIINEKIE